jgi:Cu2+-exporting ATPase
MLAASQTMLVAAGERLAADGVITKGTSRFDVSLLTGESAPVTAAVGETVYAGTLNLDGPVEVRITAAVNNTALADIARLMEQAAQSKSRYVRIADRAARLYAPAVHTLALASFAGWMIAGAGWHQALMIAVAVLIITCPCALGLAVPAAQIVAAGALMKKGILVKDGSALERLADVDVALFDKTGTLTLGRPVPLTLDHLSQTEKQVLLALARASRHPLSEAARKALEADGTMAAVIDSVVDHPGIGMTGVYDGVSVTLSRPDSQTGNASLAVQLQLGEAPGTVIRFEDQIRPGARETLAALKSMGISSSIISGDRAEAVLPVAAALGLAARSSLHPVEKLAAIDCLTQGGAKILMVGDGLNDGPALAAGHASMAPASASDAGQNAADLVFMGDSLAPVATAVSIARATQHIVRQNFAAAIAYNMIAVPLAVAGFVTPLIAALAMSGSSILVVANALRLRKAAR